MRPAMNLIRLSFHMAYTLNWVLGAGGRLQGGEGGSWRSLLFYMLTHKAPTKIVADDNRFVLKLFSEKIKREISSEYSADDSHEILSLISSKK